MVDYSHQTNRAPLSGEVEMDETYFGGKRKGKRGRGAENKIPVFGMMERNGKVVVEPIPNVSAETLTKIVKEHVRPGSRTYADQFRGCKSRLSQRNLKKKASFLFSPRLRPFSAQNFLPWIPANG